MTKRVVCKKSRCFEEGSVENELDEVYSGNDISKDIEYGLLKEMI